ncbi:MAG: AMP-forming long-chain acyl-CoA synthetase [Eubacterium sp.]|jgi:long-chain acyl-CoA synthetase|nr:AMP-forming long-chain acyl-CoA synthetase [Eubacterium sp.]
MQKTALYTVRTVENLKEMLYQSASIYGDKAAFLLNNKGENEIVTYSQFKADVDAFGTALLSLGLKDKCIAVIGENRYEWCVSYLSTVGGTGIVVPIDRELHISEIGNILQRCHADAVIYSDKHNACMEELSKTELSLKHFINMDACQDNSFYKSFRGLLEKGRMLIEAGNLDFVEANVDSNSLAVLLFTSGTTGLAKGVMLSHSNICSNVVSVRSTVLVESNDSSLSILPMHHTYECTIGFLAFIYSGATISFNEGLKYIGKNLKEVKPTILVVVPLILENLYKKIWAQAGKQRFGKIKLKIVLFITTLLNCIFHIDIRKKVFKQIHDSVGGKLRLILTGAAAIDPAVSKGFRRMGIKVLQGYGLTECAPLVTGNRDLEFRDNSVGKPLPGVEVKINNPDEKGIGEILVKGENVMLGYYRDETETKKTIVDGWFHTGDLGTIDKSGYVYITGRSKNIIITNNGKNVYPEELEASINRNPCVQESLVLGQVDESTGETHIHANILPNLEYIKEKFKGVSLSKDELFNLFNDIVKSINKDLPLYRRIRKFTLRESEFIKTTTKKIKRFNPENIKS